MEKFNNQYVLFANDSRANIDLAWNETKFQNYTLKSSPNLSIYQYSTNNLKVCLLGFCFHVLQPELDEIDILKQMPNGEIAFLDFLDCLCGNYIIFIELNGELKIYNDPAGIMKMFYFTLDGSCLCVAPDPAIIEALFSVEKTTNEEALEFYSCPFFFNNLIRLGNKSIFDNVLQVSPNHSLSVNNNTVSRYFPRKKRKEIGLKQAIDEVHTYFTACIDSAYRKFDVKCTLTAGWDSRMVLSLTKEYHNNTEYLTVINPPFKKSHHDLKVPERICKKLKLNYNLYEREVVLSSKEQDWAKQSFIWLNETNFKQVFAPFSRFNKKGQLILIGNVSEICKNYYEDVKITDGKSLAQAAHFPVMSYTVKHFQEVYNEMKIIEEKYDYDIRDIAHWEQDITNFAAMGILYRSLTTNTFSPFNCRLIINTILSVNRKLRDKQQHVFYREYINKYYPELNEFQVNPNLKKKIIVLAKKLGIYRSYKILSNKFKQ